MEVLEYSDRETTVRCARCMKVCTGETLRFNDQLFHANCLVCLVCGKDLADAGFFVQNNQYFCPEDFQERFGTKCFVCHQFLEGEGINIGGNAYHERCFVCAACRNPFPPGEKVVLKGSEYICQQCSARETSSDARGHKLEKCAGCGEDIRSGQSLLALEKQWHLWCFTCTKCGCLLAGEYMGRDGKPYCEKDYQAEFGVTCAGCGGYIIGKVLQAGEKHYHPQCSRCARCHGVFGEGQEMFLQGSEIWHPDCSFAAQQNGELDMHSAAPRDGYQNTADEEAHRPSPPTRTSASRTTDWKVKYSPQKEEETYRQEPWRGGQDEQPAYQPRYTSHTDSRPYNSSSFAEITARRETSLNEVPREKGSRAPLDMQEFEREVDKKPLTFAYKDLKTTNYKLPRGADKTKLETYLTDEEFFEVFKMTREEFYHLPNWKQGSKKKEVLLF